MFEGKKAEKLFSTLLPRGWGCVKCIIIQSEVVDFAAEIGLVSFDLVAVKRSRAADEEVIGN